MKEKSRKEFERHYEEMYSKRIFAGTEFKKIACDIWEASEESALAELEKSAAHGPIYVPDAWEKEVDRIAESYHAKKCAECWRVPRVMCSICGDPIIVGGVCENCAPEIIKNA